MKEKIRLDTYTAATTLAAIAGRIPEQITITDNKGLTINAKSVLGVVYAQMEFAELWLEAENDHYFDFKEYIIND